MKVTYDPEVDVLRIVLHSAPIEESDESKPGVILDYDKKGNVVGLEILDASTRTDSPQSMEYAVVGVSQKKRALAVRESQGAKYGTKRKTRRRSR